MSRINDIIEAKQEKRTQLESAGVEIHPPTYDKQHTIEEAIAALDTDTTVKTAGRIISYRGHGQVIFADIQDTTGRMQIMVRQDSVDEEAFDQLAHVDNGDFIGVTGTVQTTKTGETTIFAEEYEFLGKALRPIPSEWNTAEDKEVRFRKRYLDMLANPDVKWILDTRWKTLKEIRRFLQDEHNFVEVETPILQPLYGGTNASPFTTYMNALSSEFYLRVAPELYLKRLIVGGYDKVFEIARNFRNEGIDQTHQPEFTMIEWYETYADYHRMMDVAEDMVKRLVASVHGEMKLEVGDLEIDVSGDWPRIRMIDALQEYADIDFESLDTAAITSLLAEHDIELAGEYSDGKAMFELFDELVTPQLIEPIWITDYPRDISPLAKHHRDDDRLAERFEAYIGGKELADGWSEITDPLDQRNIFENEQRNMRAGDDEAHPLDEDFLEAMEYGMPPLGGIGMGIDRLIMFLTNTWSIKEVIAFPTLRPLQANETAQTDPGSSTTERAGLSQEVEEVAEDDEKPTDSALKSGGELPPREESQALLEEKIQDPNLRNHCQMVAWALEAYAEKLDEDPELWYQTGLLHDIDWEMHPDEHPNLAVREWLTEYPAALRQAVLAHAPARTGRTPESTLDRYLFACDELSGFITAYALMRPTNFEGMKPKKVLKKLENDGFAAGVDREDVAEAFKLIEESEKEHIQFLIDVFHEREALG